MIRISRKVSCITLLCITTLSNTALIGLPQLSKTAVGCIAAAAAAAGPFIHGLCQTPVTPAVNLEHMHLTTMQPARDIHQQWPRADMKTIAHRVRSGQVQARYWRDPKSFEGPGSWAVSSGIPHGSQETIFIYSHGWKSGPCETWAQHIGGYRSNGVGLLVGQQYMTKGIVNGPMVVFDYPTDPTRSFNIGQETDVECLYTVYKHVVENNPQASIVFVGDCKGATAVLRLITHQKYNTSLANLKAVLLESPPLSLNAAIRTVSNSYLPWLQSLAYPLINNMAKAWLPAYRTYGDCTALFQPESITPHVAVFIGSMEHDLVASHTNVVRLMDQFKQVGNNNLHLFTTQEPLKHGCLSNSNNYVNSANAFLKTYNLPHNAKKAAQGEFVLTQAREHAINAHAQASSAA